MQAIIKDENHLARFLPCCSHSLNLVGVNAACSNVSAKNFFGTIQTLFNFLSSSTTRWEKLTSIIKISLKKHADTRWCPKANAVNAVYRQYESIISVLRKMKDDYTVSDTYSIASALHIFKPLEPCLKTFGTFKPLEPWKK